MNDVNRAVVFLIALSTFIIGAMVGTLSEAKNITPTKMVMSCTKGDKEFHR